MYGYIIKVKHVYQDRDNPHIQVIELGGDYSIRYALFMALIDSGKEFKIEIAGDE